VVKLSKDMIAGLITAIILLIIWSVIWKGIALWHAARNNQRAWYIALLIINTVGILEIVYLSFFKKKREAKKPIVKDRKKK